MRFATFRWALLALVIPGCTTTRNGSPTTRFTGPTLTFAQFAQRINANNTAIPSISAGHYFEATIVDKDKDGKERSTFINGGGTVQILKPRDMIFVGKKEGLGVELVRMGSNADLFWLTVAERNISWWGHYKNVGKPCMKDMPIRPDLLLEVVGVSDIDPDFLKDPAPVMRFNPDERVYMVVWNALAKDHWFAQKEVWYDADTLLPLKVILFDLNGRPVLRANLANHAAIAIDGTPEAQWPKIATDFRLYFPETRSKLWIRLEDTRLKNARGFPKPGVIKYDPRDLPSDIRPVQIDADCD